MSLTRPWRIAAAILAGLGLLLLAVAVFPWGVLKPVVERRLEARLGRPVTIGRLERLDRFGFSPRLAIRNLRVPQVAWAGSGDLAQVDEAEATVPLLSLFAGRVRPRDVHVRGLSLALVRRADGASNWRGPGQAGDAPGLADLGTVRIVDSRIAYRDDMRGRSFVLAVAAADRGMRAEGTGAVLETPVRVSLRGGAAASDRPWRFVGIIDGAALHMNVKGTARRPFDFDHMSLAAVARADDLKLIDAIIEAGLFGTQPVSFDAHVRREPGRWTIDALRGRIGGSPIVGRGTVAKAGERTRLDGSVAFARLDFDDLASDEQLAAARSLRARIGERFVPNTRIDLAKLGEVDGVLRLRIGPTTSGGQPLPVRAATATAVLDHGLLTVDPIAVRLPRGSGTGRVVVDQRGGRTVPLLTMTLAVRDTELARLVGGGVAGPLAARVRLSGVGRTIREAVGVADGTIGAAVRNGSLPRRTAYAGGFTPLRVVFADAEERAVLRCGVVRLDVRGGRGRSTLLAIDTGESRMAGRGEIVFPAETLAFRMTGAPKRAALLRLDGAVLVGGTISDPALTIPRGVRSAGNILKALRKAVTGKQAPEAVDANCVALTAAALR